VARILIVRNKLTKTELVERVERLMSGRWSEAEAESLLREIRGSVPCPESRISHIIFHSKDNPAAEVMVERMLAYKAIEL